MADKKLVKEITSMEELSLRMQYYKAGDTVDVTIKRASDGAYVEFLYDVYSEGVTIQHFNSDNQPDETKSNGVIVTSHNPTSSDNVITNIYSKTVSISW